MKFSIYEIFHIWNYLSHIWKMLSHMNWRKIICEIIQVTYETWHFICEFLFHIWNPSFHIWNPSFNIWNYLFHMWKMLSHELKKNHMWNYLGHMKSGISYVNFVSTLEILHFTYEILDFTYEIPISYVNWHMKFS